METSNNQVARRILKECFRSLDAAFWFDQEAAAEIIGEHHANLREELTAATARAEGLEKGISALHRIVAGHSFPGIDTQYVAMELAALLPQPKEVGK